MRYGWQYPSLLLAGEIVAAQRVLQGSVQHFESQAAGPWQPLLSLGFGTPPQEITGIFDSGSSDTIIPLAGSPLCQVPNQQCTDSAPNVQGEFDAEELIVRGEFDPGQVSDVKQLPGEKFNASFSGGDEFDGEYIKTTVTVGTDDKNQVPGAQVALASGGQPAGDFPQFSIYGVGPRELEATDKKYDNLPQVMKDAGVIKGNSYSVVLNPTPLANGSVFFGGIDRSKFSGELQQVAIDRDNLGKISDFVVKISSVRLDMSGGNNNQTATATKNQRRARMRLKRSISRRATRGRVYSKAQGTYGGAGGQVVGASRISQSRHNNNGGNGGNGNNGRGGQGGNGGDGNGNGGNGSGGGNGNGGNGGNGNGGNGGNGGKGNGGQGGQGGQDGQDGQDGDGNGDGNGGQGGNDGNGNGNGGNGGNYNNNKNKNNNGNGNNGNGNNGNGNNGNGNNGNNNKNGNNGNNNNGNNGNKNNGNNGNNNGNNGNNNNGNNGNKNNGNNGNNNSSGLINLGLQEDERFTLFDTGGVVLTLPAGVLKNMAQALDTDFSDQDGIGPVECSKLNAGNKLVMGFNDDDIQVSLGLDKIRISDDLVDSEVRDAGLCVVGAEAVPPDDNLSIMGFPFYTDVYTVFDLENNSLWFAQAKGDPSAPGEQLEEFP